MESKPPNNVIKKFNAKNNVEVIIRYIEWSDLDDYIDFWESLFTNDDELKLFLGPIKQESKSDYAKKFFKIISRISENQEIRLIAEVNGKMIGYASIKRDEGSFGHRGWLGIIVRREFRNIGIGTELLRAVIDEAKKHGFKLILLETSSLNSRAIHVFEKVGFKIIGKIPSGMKIDDQYVDTLIMALQL